MLDYPMPLNAKDHRACRWNAKNARETQNVIPWVYLLMLRALMDRILTQWTRVVRHHHRLMKQGSLGPAQS